MKINLIQNSNIDRYSNMMTNPSSNVIKNIPISFHSQQDEFKRQTDQTQKPLDYDYIDKTLSSLRIKMEELLARGVNIKESNNLSALERYNNNLMQIRTEYKKIIELLNQCNTNEFTQNAQIIANFLQQMEQMEQNRGFNRIVGYDEVKNNLKNKFIFDSILKDKISDDTRVPDALLFFGPAGNGKTTFAKALSEQALMTPYIVNAANTSEEEAMNMIENYANQSKKIYETSKDKKRSIIIVDEADTLLYKDSPVVERFKNLIKNCAEEYNCTLFLTTNNPLDLPEEILSKDITPFKVAIASPDRYAVKSIIDKKLNEVSCTQKVDTNKIVDELFKNPEKIYSTANIVELIQSTLKENEAPTTKDFIRTINNGNILASLSNKDMKRLKKEIEELK